MVKTAKDDRLVIRMPQALREWIDAKADEVGLDAASWVRMRLTLEMRGMPPAPAAPETFVLDTTNWPAASITQPADRTVAQPLDPAALDALVSEGLAAAEAHGLTEPVESEEGQAETMRLGEPSRATMRNLVANGSARPL